MMQHRELLRAYWRDGSEPAFAELVQRYVGLVFSAAPPAGTLGYGFSMHEPVQTA